MFKLAIRQHWPCGADAVDGLCDRDRVDRRGHFAAGSSCWWWHGQRWRTPAGPLREQLTIKLNILRAPELVQAQLGDEAGCLGSALLAWEAFDTSAANRQALG